MKKKPRQPKTAVYYFFYLLFSTDFWRILMGVAVSILATPHLAPPDFSAAGRIMLYGMVAAIGWSITAAPSRWITRGLKKAILGERR